MIRLSNAKTVTITLPKSDVFEDTAPRLLDVDADGSPEVVVVQSWPSTTKLDWLLSRQISGVQTVDLPLLGLRI